MNEPLCLSGRQNGTYKIGIKGLTSLTCSLQGEENSAVKERTILLEGDNHYLQVEEGSKR